MPFKPTHDYRHPQSCSEQELHWSNLLPIQPQPVMGNMTLYQVMLKEEQQTITLFFKKKKNEEPDIETDLEPDLKIVWKQM